MTELVIRNFWWPEVTKKVKKYIEGCNVYQRNNNFITKLLLAQGYDSILVVCNRLTKMTYFVPTTERILAERVARLFRNNVWKLYSLPESIIIDIGAQFVAGMMRELNTMLGINTKLSMAYHSQTDEQTKE